MIIMYCDIDFFFQLLAPSPIDTNHTAVAPTSDTSLRVTWQSPDTLNGQLTHYTVVIYNEWTDTNRTLTVPASNSREVSIPDLRKLKSIIFSVKHNLTVLF